MEPSSSSSPSPPLQPPPQKQQTRRGKGEGRDKPRKAPLKILCFGDSLTAGFPAGHPYGGRLEERLADALPHLAPICEVDGVPGNRVTPDSYRRRMETAWTRRGGSGSGRSGPKYMDGAGDGEQGGEGEDERGGEEDGRQQQQQQREPEFHWTIVLGGTNDLGWGVPAADVIEGLKATWDVPLRRGGKVLALTVPEVRHERPATDEARDEINAAIKAYDRPNL